MRLLLILFVFVSVNSFAQEEQRGQNLYAHVESIMKKEFDFECDKSCHEEKSVSKEKKMICGTAFRNGGNSSDKVSNANKANKKQHKETVCHTHASTMSRHPLVILNGVPVKNDTLKSYGVKQVKSIETLKGPKAAALYGTRGSKGVVLIELED